MAFPIQFQFQFQLFLFATLSIIVHGHGMSEEGLGFSYTAEKNGPEKWGSISDDYSTCQSGESQSPIDIIVKETTENKNLKTLTRKYKAVEATFINHKYMLELHLGNAGGFNFDGKDYTLKQIHWHTPSEHTIDGQQYDAEGHLVHVASDGSKAVIAILYQIGNADPIIAKLQGKLKELAKEKCGPNEISHIPAGKFNTQKLERNTRKYYHYVGSLTSPPCSETLNWIILGKVRSISKKQVELLQDPLDSTCKKNNRPVQPMNGRQVALYSESH
ncbi:alpha carbonic anhydrase 1, chloroplastic-like [Impatiens glandulifera]|uniref:alpha carbonic anhydrase 1, chloroplastic-like n=1 Tax=Impatiens glandulifera TaxID=253017 RepID=UPI001FB0BAD6|nr:alpha carbonic anhydrase 1, chloroplastic-like [Impatiens glandulifera]